MALKTSDLLIFGGVVLGGFALWNYTRNKTQPYYKDDGSFFQATQPTIRTIERQGGYTDRVNIRNETIREIFSSGTSRRTRKVGDEVGLSEKAQNQIKELNTPVIKGELKDILKNPNDTTRIRPASQDFINTIQDKQKVGNKATIIKISDKPSIRTNQPRIILDMDKAKSNLNKVRNITQYINPIGTLASRITTKALFK